MKSRRRIAYPKAQLRDLGLQLQQEFASGEMGLVVSLHGSHPEPLMSAMGQKQTLAKVRLMSALPPKADISWGARMWVPRFFLLRPGAIVPMESARYQGHERRGASNAF
jgi:hypothetical protein